MSERRDILHVDMDAFYASVEQLDRPELRGRPVIVGGSPESRGVVSTASYEAREFGIHSAMPATQAIRLCPDGVFVKVRMPRYAEMSSRIHQIFHRFTPLVEPLSLDEAFLDVTGSKPIFGSAEEIGRAIKKAIKDETGLIASVGLAPNKFLAKLASDLEKPDGFVVIEADSIQQTLDPLPVGRLWGVGRMNRRRLNSLGLKRFVDVRKRGLDRLESEFGELGRHIWRISQGLDDRTVTPDHEAKSLGAERTFPEDIADGLVQMEILLHLADHVAWRLRRSGLQCRRITIKLRYGNFRTITRAETLDDPTDVTDHIRIIAARLHEVWSRSSFGPLRLLGISCGLLSPAGSGQLTLFDDAESAKQRRLDATVDAIKSKFGDVALQRGGFKRPKRFAGPDDPRQK